MSSRIGKREQQAALAVTPPPGQVTRLVTAARGVLALVLEVEEHSRRTAGRSSECDNGKKFGEGHDQ